MADAEYAGWKMADLKKELKAKGLPVSGKKEELVERLQASNDQSTDLLDEDDDLLHADDTLLTDESIKKAEEELSAQAKSPKKKIAIKRDVPIPAAVPEEEKEEVKKVEVTNNSEDLSSKESPSKHPKITGPESSPPDDTKENEVDNADKTKSPPPTETVDKIKARAERFGGFQSDGAKKTARAERFADQLNGNRKGVSKIGGAPTVDLDTLKKRAERFGTSSSTAMKKAELSEAMKRRQERFGVISAADEPKPKKVQLNSGVNSVVLDEKMQKRKERFGM